MQELQAQREEAAKLRLIERKKRQKKTSPGLAKQMTLNTAKYQKMVAEAGGLKPLIMAQNWIHRPPKSKKDRKKMEIAAARKKEYDYTPGPTEDSPIGEPVTDLSTLLDYLVPIKEQEENPRYFMESTSRPPPPPHPQKQHPQDHFILLFLYTQIVSTSSRRSKSVPTTSLRVLYPPQHPRPNPDQQPNQDQGPNQRQEPNQHQGPNPPRQQPNRHPNRHQQKAKNKDVLFECLYPTCRFSFFVRVISASRSFEHKSLNWLISLLDKIEVQQQSQTC